MQNAGSILITLKLAIKILISMTITISIAITMTMIMTTYLILNGFFTLIPQPFYVQGDLDPLVA